MRRPRVATAAGLLVTLLAVLAPSPVSAAPITIGPTLQSGYSGASYGAQGPAEFTLANLLLAESNQSATSPVDGTVVGWQIVEKGSTGGFKLQIIHPNSDGTFTVTASSAEALPTTAPASTSLPISAGDYIGVETIQSVSFIGVRNSVGAKLFYWGPPLGITPRAPSATTEKIEIGLDAFVQPGPSITALSQSSGPATGGTALTISGAYFTNATEVRFGATAVPLLVNSDNAITVTAPPGSLGTVDVTVRTPYGTSRHVDADKFTYTAPAQPPATSASTAPAERCVVPKLKGRSLKADRRTIKKAGCALGKVSGKKVRGATIRRQSVKPGTVLPAGSAIGVKVG